jgi:hypothetical protein
VAVHIYTQTIYRTTQITANVEQGGPCHVFAGFTLAFALQLRKKHGKTSVRLRKTLEYSIHITTTPTHTHINTHTHTHITKPTHTHTHYKAHTHTHTHITKPTHTHITKPTHTHTTKPTHTHTHIHIHTHTHTHTLQNHTHTHTQTLQNNIKPPQYKLKQTQYKIYQMKQSQHNQMPAV